MGRDSIPPMSPLYPSARFTLKQLRLFVSVAEHGSIRLAARELNMTQPPVSRQLRQLEESLGCTLFDRAQRRLVLTATGEHFLEQCRGLLDSAGRVVQELQAYDRGESGELRLGLTDDFMNAPVFKRTLDFMASNPGIAFHTRLEISTRLLEHLQAGELDLIFANLPLDCDADKIVTIPLPATRLVVVVPPDHPWAGKRKIRPALLDGEPMLLMERDSRAPFALQYRKLFAAESIAPAPSAVSEHPEVQLQMVRHGLGVGLITEQSLAEQHSDLVKIPLDHPLARVQHGLLYRRDFTPPAMLRLLKALDVLT